MGYYARRRWRNVFILSVVMLIIYVIVEYNDPKMSTPSNPNPTPFEKFKAIAEKVVSVPKSEVEKAEKEWRKEREANAKKKPQEPR